MKIKVALLFFEKYDNVILQILHLEQIIHLYSAIIKKLTQQELTHFLNFTRSKKNNKYAKHAELKN